MQCHDKRDKAMVNKDTDSCMLRIYCTVYYLIPVSAHSEAGAPLYQTISRQSH